MTTPRKARLFFCYAEKDEPLYHELETHLSQLRHSGLIESWHVGNLKGGDEQEAEIIKHLDDADIILLLISADFLAAKRCYDVEMKRALERHSHRTARVIPIRLRPVEHGGAPFDGLQVLPSRGKAITTWKNRDVAWAKVASGIRVIVTELLQIEQTGRKDSVSMEPIEQARSVHDPGLLIHRRISTPAPMGIPEGYVCIELGASEILFKLDEYRNVQQMMNHLYINYLSETYKPYTYGQDWALSTDSHVERMMLPLQWLSSPDKNLSNWVPDLSLSECGLKSRTTWRVTSLDTDWGHIIGLLVSDARFLKILQSSPKALFKAVKDRCLELCEINTITSRELTNGLVLRARIFEHLGEKLAGHIYVQTGRLDEDQLALYEKVYL